MATGASLEVSDPGFSLICQVPLLAGVFMNTSSGFFGKRTTSNNN
jgi:hypothetical protein